VVQLAVAATPADILICRREGVLGGWPVQAGT